MSWGPPPFEERDLDALLSGYTADVPPGLRQVADALAALRAGPARAELRGEAAIMAEFSAQSGGQEHTLVLPLTVPDDVRRRQARHRVRRPARPKSLRAGALMGAAAAAILVTVVVFSGGLPGSIEHLARTASPSASSHAEHDSGSSNVQSTGAAAEPASSPALAHKHSPLPSPSPQLKELCHTYFGYFAHSEPRSKWAAEFALFIRISKLVGGVDHVFADCGPYVQDLFPHGTPWNFPPIPDSHHGKGDSGQDSQGLPAAGSQGVGGVQGNASRGAAAKPDAAKPGGANGPAGKLIPARRARTRGPDERRPRRPRRVCAAAALRLFSKRLDDGRACLFERGPLVVS